MSAFFIAGSGTGVGKTFITSTLVHQLIISGEQALALKPVVTGYDYEDEKNDVRILLAAQSLDATSENISLISPFRFKHALSPNMAANRALEELSVAAIVEYCKKHFSDQKTTLIEGVGGVMTPINNQHTVLDLIEAISAPVILVVGSYLGSISHALTAYFALVSRKVKICALVVNESKESAVSLAETIESIKNFIDKEVQVVAMPRVFSIPEFKHSIDIMRICRKY